MQYKDSNELAQENKSSAWALLIVGGIGLVLAVLCITGILPVWTGNIFIFYGLGVVSIVFIVMSFVSLKNAKGYAGKAESEKSRQKAIIDWCKENISALEIDDRIENYGVTPEEVIYFRRVECVRNMINKQFPGLDPNFVEYLIDDCLYDMIFEK